VSLIVPSSTSTQARRRALRIASTVLLLAFLSACGPAPSKTVIYTLYRSSPDRDDLRIHVATFDAAEDRDYNRNNCEIARDLFAKQPGVTVRYWCERGRFER
jgi:hypothetical protein